MSSNRYSVVDLDVANKSRNKSDKYIDERVGRIIQVNLTPVRCAECDALLLQASTGSVVSIMCGRCKSFNVVEVKEI